MAYTALSIASHGKNDHELKEDAHSRIATNVYINITDKQANEVC